MSGTQGFTGFFAIVSLAVSAAAIWRVARAPAFRYKPLWIAGSLFGFVGFATDLSVPGDLYFQIGVQVPVIIIWWIASGHIVLKALFPIVAVAALVQVHAAEHPPAE